MTEQNTNVNTAEENKTVSDLEKALASIQSTAQQALDVMPLGAALCDRDPETAVLVAHAAAMGASRHLGSTEVIELLSGLVSDPKEANSIRAALVTLRYTVTSEAIMSVNQMFSDQMDAGDKRETH